ncbi:primosomal protein N' [Bartonella callosciuri]|uniref:Primosomal protein N n=1 Tax=Bartonella callosciuri TaxID=686223 RepID=A0A840NT35_9HYPH|nr:primosomal protein N' [Bartonella callosciuri]
MIVSLERCQAAEHYARMLRQVAPCEKNISVMGPAEIPLALVRGRYRFRLLLQGQRSFDIQGFIRIMFTSVPKMLSSVRVQIDIDPQSFLLFSGNIRYYCLLIRLK